MKSTFVLPLLLAGTVLAGTEQIVVYPVQSGMVDDSSCCSPYQYQDSAAGSFVLSGCFDSYYGCGHQLERGVWRFDVASMIPEDAEVNSATLVWNHPSSTSSYWNDLYIDANTQVLSSAYCSAMRSSADQVIYDYNYWSSQVSIAINPAVVSEGAAGGFISFQISNGEGADGATFINTGLQAPRIVVELNLNSPVGACCLPNGYCAELPQHTCENGQNTVFHGPGSTCGSDNTCPSDGCDGDIDDDGQVSVSDLLAVISAWGPCADCAADSDGSGSVDISDLLNVIDNWGTCQ